VILLIGSIEASKDCPVDRKVKYVDEFKEALPFCKKTLFNKGGDKGADLN